MGPPSVAQNLCEKGGSFRPGRGPAGSYSMSYVSDVSNGDASDV